MDADYGYEDKGDEVDNITPKDESRQFRCYDLHTESECENVLGCYYLYHHSHGTGSGSCWGEPLDWDHLSGNIPEEIPGLIPLGRSAGNLDDEDDGKGDELERTAPNKDDLSVEYDYVYEEEELPNNEDKDISMSVLALKVAHLEKETSELVKAIGDSGRCPSITAAIKVVIRLLAVAVRLKYELVSTSAKEHDQSRLLSCKGGEV